jgi:alkanesulfonate monooxygenase SsuD/methylene tetrahydromethanopterin reductase-like flavin-dependent oxidoreductase (luciferase family)
VITILEAARVRRAGTGCDEELPVSPTFHLFLPQMRMSYDAIVERALAAEAAGFEGIAFMDHLVPPLAPEHDMWEAMTIAGWVLAKTTRLKVGHLVLCDLMRHPAVLARQAVSLDHASGGRFELGIGWGSVPEELETFGVGTTEPRERVARLGESLEIMRRLWTGEVVDFEGEYFTLCSAQQRPVPTGRIPITVGGVGKRTRALVREHADWWNVPIYALNRVAELRDSVGDVPVSIQQMAALLRNEQERADVTALIDRRFGLNAMAKDVVIGTVPELVDHYSGLAASGIDRFCVWFTDFAPVDTLERFAEVIDGVQRKR